MILAHIIHTIFMVLVHIIITAQGLLCWKFHRLGGGPGGLGDGRGGVPHTRLCWDRSQGHVEDLGQFCTLVGYSGDI